MRKPLLAAIVLILLLLVGVAVLTGVFDGEDEKAPAIVTIPVDGLDAGRKDDRTIKVPATVIQQVAPVIEDQLREPPAATPAPDLRALVRAADRIRRTQTPLPTAGATAGFKGCRTSFVRNQSSRHGVRPQLQVLHYTVSPNRPGWSDVNAIVALFDRSSSQASSHFIVDGEGHCAYTVPIEAKAWTQAGGNPFSVSYEIIATGKEQRYLAAPGLAKLRSIAREVARRTGVPVRSGAVNGCAPSRKGFVQHRDFGICGGGHVDVSPFNAAQVIRQLAAGSASCNRACDLRRRHKSTISEIKRRKCAPADKTRSSRCTTLHRRHRALDAAAKRAGVKF